MRLIVYVECIDLLILCQMSKFKFILNWFSNAITNVCNSLYNNYVIIKLLPLLCTVVIFLLTDQSIILYLFILSIIYNLGNI